MGPNRAPWPYAMLYTFLNPDRAPTDLSSFKGIQFYARGNGKVYEVVLHQKVITDFGFYRASFQAGKDWAPVSLDWKDFKQANWPKPVVKSFVDVDQIQFSAASLNDEDYELAIDDVRFK